MHNYTLINNNHSIFTQCLTVYLCKINETFELKKRLKIAQLIGLSIIGLMLIVSALLLVFKDLIKDKAIQELNTYLNKKVHISYVDVGIWNTFPNLSIRFDNVLIHSRFNDEQTIDTALFAKELSLRFNPIEFFKGNYTVNKIGVSDALFSMEIKKDGTINYDFIKSQPDSINSSPDFYFELEAITLRNTSFRYLNHATKQDYATHIDEMHLNGAFSNTNYVLGASTNFHIKHIKNKELSLIKNKTATCNLSLNIDNSKNIVAVQDAGLTINSIPFAIDGKVTGDSIDFRIGAPEIHLKEFVKNFTLEELNLINDVNGDGDVNINVHIRGPIEATTSPAIDAHFFIKNGSLSDNGFNITKLHAEGSYTNGVATKKEALTLNKLSFNSLGGKFEGHINVTDFNQPRLKGRAKGSVNLQLIHRLFGPFNLQSLEGLTTLDGSFDLRLNDPKYDPKNISIYDLRASASVENVNVIFKGEEQVYSIDDGEFVIRNQKAVLKHIHFKTKQTDLTIDGTFNQIADYFKKTKTLYIDASIESNYLDIHELSSSTANNERNWLLPNDIDGKVHLDLKKVIYSDHTYENIKTRMLFEERALNFPYISGENAGSKIKGSLHINEQQPMVLYVNTQLTSPAIYFDQLFSEWNNFDQTTITAENISGHADVQLNFKGAFNLFTAEIYKDEFDATIDVSIKDGALLNVETFKEITESLKESSARLVISKEQINAFEKELLQLNFEELNNELKIENGVLYIPKMEIKSNALDLKLSGSHTFDNIVDYSFEFRFRELKEKETSEFGEIIDDGTGFRVFLRMKGSIDDPTFSWDKEAQRQLRQENREQAKEDFKSVLKTGLGINKKDTTIQEYKTSTKPEEKMIVTYATDSIENSFNPDQKKKRKGKLLRKFDEWTKENEREKEQLQLEE